MIIRFKIIFCITTMMIREKYVISNFFILGFLTKTLVWTPVCQSNHSLYERNRHSLEKNVYPMFVCLKSDIIWIYSTDPSTVTKHHKHRKTFTSTSTFIRNREASRGTVVWITQTQASPTWPEYYRQHFCGLK